MFRGICPALSAPVFDVTGIGTQHAVGGLTGELDKGAFEDVAVFGEVMHGAVLKLGEPHADGTAGGIADVSAQSAM